MYEDSDGCCSQEGGSRAGLCRIALIWITKTSDNAIINNLLFKKKGISCVCLYIYNISGDVGNIFYQSCAQIDNNQQVYEAQIQMPRCNSILKAGSHECQKIRPLHIDRCTGEHTDHNPKATHLNVCLLLSVWARSCFWIGVSTLQQIFPHPLFLFTLYFIIIINIFTSVLLKVAYIR